MTGAHHITVEDVAGTVRVEVDGTVVAESERARVLREGSITPRYYLPRVDVKMELLEATDTSTRCPFKGEASYWSLLVDDRRHDDIAWSYEDPIPGMETIAGLVCFYNERVELVVAGEPQ